MTPYSGKIIAARIVTLRFSQSGYTISVNVEPGQVVTKGQVLAALDPKPVQTQLDVELADYRRLRSEFDQLSRDLPEAKMKRRKVSRK